jgi:regulator of protease activity HflC (stomatin/prohibitin superfamily)
MSEQTENAMIWGERELERSGEGRVRELLRASGKHLRKLAWWLVGIALAIVILPRAVIFVPPGHGGVLWSRFLGGTVIQPSLSEGFHLIWPWNHIEEFELRVRDLSIDYPALANDGLPVTATVSLRYRVNPARLANLYQDVGQQYEQTMIAPQIGSIVREVMSRYPADQLYAYARARLESEILEIITDKLDFAQVIAPHKKQQEYRDGYIFVEGLSVLDVKLPPTVTSAIEGKMAQDQSAQEYEFKVKREQLETERRAIEVDGIRNYGSVAQTPWFRDYLRYIEIQSNYDLAKSTNAKLVFLGNSAPSTTPMPPLNLTVPSPGP